MVDEGIVTSDQLTHALAEQERTSRPLGEILVELGFASPGAVANALAEQHGGLLKTEYGVSAGLRAVTEAGLANAPVRPMLPSPEGRLTPTQPDAQEEPAAPLRVVAVDPPDGGPPVAPTPTVATPDPPAQMPNAEELRIADLTSRLDDAVSKLRVSQQARDAFSKRVNELETQLASVESAPQADSVPQIDPGQAARIEQLEAHIQQLDAHIQAAAADRENIVQHYTELQAQLAAAQAATSEADPAQAARIEELEAQLQVAAVDRQGLVESLTELQTRLGETSQARGEELAEASAGAAAHLSVLEGQLKEATLDRGLIEQRVSELQGALLASEQARVGEIQNATAEALARIAELESQLQQAALNLTAAESESDDAPEPGRVAELEVQLQAVSEERDAILAGLADDDATSAKLREDIAERDRQLAENVNEVARLNREHRAELEEQLREAEAAAAAVQTEGDAPDPGRVAGLEEQLADRERQLAENDAILASIAEHHATLERLREELADRDRQLAEHAEQDAALNGLREGIADLDRRLAEQNDTMAGLREDLADRDRQLAAHVPVEAAIEDETAHVLFIPTPSGYSLRARTGPPPEVGSEVEVGGDAEGAGRFVVRKHGRPLPGGPCYAYVERI